MNFLLCKFLLKCLSINPLALFKHGHKWKICRTFQLVFEKFCLKKQFDILKKLSELQLTAIIGLEITNAKSRKKDPKITMHAR